MRIGFKFRLGSLWVGAHWSPKNRRWCVNLLPCCTVWIVLKDGLTPDEENKRQRIADILLTPVP